MGAGFRATPVRAVGSDEGLLIVDAAVRPDDCNLACAGRVAIEVAERGRAAAFAPREPIEVAGRFTLGAAGTRGGRTEAAVVGRVTGAVLGARLEDGDGFVPEAIREGAFDADLVDNAVVAVEVIGRLPIAAFDAGPVDRVDAAADVDAIRLAFTVASERDPAVAAVALLAFKEREAVAEPIRPRLGRVGTVLGAALIGTAKGLSSSTRVLYKKALTRKGVHIPSSGSRRISQLSV